MFEIIYYAKCVIHCQTISTILNPKFLGIPNWPPDQLTEFPFCPVHSLALLHFTQSLSKLQPSGASTKSCNTFIANKHNPQRQQKQPASQSARSGSTPIYILRTTTATTIHFCRDPHRLTNSITGITYFTCCAVRSDGRAIIKSLETLSIRVTFVRSLPFGQPASSTVGTEGLVGPPELGCTSAVSLCI